MDAAQDRLLALLGGWPEHFGEGEIKHGQSLLNVLRRERVLDEVVFGLLVRYATHRAAFDRVSVEITDDEMKAGSESLPAEGGHYLSGKEQSRAFHENKLLVLERELLATPYSRAKAGLSSQTSFMDILNQPDPDGDGGGEDSDRKDQTDRVVMPFKPLSRRGAG